MLATIASTLAGVLSGFLLSVAFWAWLTHGLTPKLKFAEDIGVLRSASCTSEYRIKVMNMSKRRALIDLSISGVIRFPGFSSYAETTGGTVPTIRLVLSSSHSMRVAPGYSKIIRILVPETLSGSGASRIDRALGSGRARQRGRFCFLRCRPSESPCLTLEDFMGRHAKAHIRFYVLCYDEWSGSRKYFASPDYSVQDIKSGKFVGLKVRTGE